MVQGGVVSPILFNMMINDIYDNVPNECSYALYADDCAIWIQGRRLPQLVTTMQRALDTIQTWADNWGFTLTPSKCSAVIFSRYMNKRELHNITPLKINNEVLSYNDDVKFLGVFFDSRLNMNKHVHHIKAKALKRLPLLKCLAGLAELLARARVGWSFSRVWCSGDSLFGTYV